MLSFADIPALLNRLDTIKKTNPEHLTFTYQKLFTTPEGELILMDLMDRFFEFKPTVNDREAGSQAVVIYIKNRLLGVTEPPEGPPGEEHVE